MKIKEIIITIVLFACVYVGAQELARSTAKNHLQAEGNRTDWYMLRDASELIPQCANDKHDKFIEEKAYCGGVQLGIVAASKESYNICIPEHGLAMIPGIIKEALRDYPQHGHFSYPTFAYSALKGYFPCGEVTYE